MTVSHPAQQVCLLRKALPIPTGHGTGQLVKGEIVTVVSSHGEECTISLLMDSSQVYTCHEKNLKMVGLLQSINCDWHVFLILLPMYFE